MSLRSRLFEIDWRGILKHTLLLGTTLVWEYWLGRTKKLAANSTVELIGYGWRRLFKKENQMTIDKDVKLGNVGDLDLKLEKGKATVTLTVGLELPAAALSANSASSVSMDANVLIDKLFDAIEKSSPAGAQPIEEGVKAVIKAAAAAV